MAIVIGSGMGKLGANMLESGLDEVVLIAAIAATSDVDLSISQTTNTMAFLVPTGLTISSRKTEERPEGATTIAEASGFLPGSFHRLISDTGFDPETADRRPVF